LAANRVLELFNGIDVGTPLNCEQRVRCFNHAMLSRVAGQYHAGILLTGKTKELEHLPATNLPSLVDVT
jgi:hypothetical protein